MILFVVTIIFRNGVKWKWKSYVTVLLINSSKDNQTIRSSDKRRHADQDDLIKSNLPESAATLHNR